MIPAGHHRRTGRLSGLLSALVAALWLALALGAPAFAQEEPDYAAWDKLARQTETVLQGGDASAQALDTARAALVGWRDQFSQAQGINAPRIAAAKDQIAGLGPAPAEGETEAADIADRRKQLNTELADLQAPGIRADEAYRRADSLIRAVDETIRARRADDLLRQTPSPLLPSSLIAAASDGIKIVQGIVQDVRDRTYGAAKGALVTRLPVVGLYLALALGLLIFGRRWIDSLPSRLGARASDYSRDALAFGVSLGQIVVPTVGVYLFLRALDTTGLAGPWARPVLMALPIASLMLFGGRWLSLRFFPEASDPPICYSEVERSDGRLYGTALSGALALHHAVGRALLPLSGVAQGQDDAGSRIPLEVGDAAAGVWHLPIILLGSFLLFRLGGILRNRPGAPGDEGLAYRARVMAVLGWIARLIAIAAPILTLAGYVMAANALLWPAAMTIGLAMLVIVLQEFVTDLWSIVKRDRGVSRDALAPVLIGFLLVIGAVPLLALLWGASSSDLAEGWTQLRQGVSLGGVRLSPGAVITFVIVFSIGYILTRALQGTVRNSILPRTRLDAGTKNAAVSGLGYVGIFVAALIAITAAGINLSSLAIVAGALSVGIGFGLQNIVSNFVSGIILLIERPVAVGDWIQVGSAQGHVRRISVRSTQIQTFDRTDVIVPNSDLISKEVTNWTRGNQQGRIIVKVGVAYGSDTRKVAEVLRGIAEDQPTVLINPPPTILFAGFGADSLDFEIRAILSDINQGVRVSSDIRHEIIRQFADAGIEIPFAHREVRIINPADLGVAAGGGTAPVAGDDDAGPAT